MDMIDREGWSYYRMPDGSLFPLLQGAKGEPPAPAEASPEEKRLQTIQADTAQEQLAIAKKQQAENEALNPILLSEYDLTRTVDPVTGAISYTKNANALTDKRKEIEGMQLDRSLKALKGELPVTATLAREIEMGKRNMTEKLNRQLGPGWELSSAGIQSMDEYDRMATSLKEAEQKDQLSTAEALSIGRQNSRQSNSAGTFDLTNRGSSGASALYGNAGSSAGSALGYYGQLRQASERAQSRSDDNTSGFISGGMGLVGTGGVMAYAI